MSFQSQCQNFRFGSPGSQQTDYGSHNGSHSPSAHQTQFLQQDAQDLEVFPMASNASSSMSVESRALPNLFPNPLFQPQSIDAESSMWSSVSSEIEFGITAGWTGPNNPSKSYTESYTQWDVEDITSQWGAENNAEDTLCEMPYSVTGDDFLVPVREDVMNEEIFNMQPDTPFDGPSGYIQGLDKTPETQPHRALEHDSDPGEMNDWFAFAHTPGPFADNVVTSETPQERRGSFDMDVFNMTNPAGTPLPDLTPQYLAWIETIRGTVEFDILMNDATLYAQSLMTAVPGEISDIAFIQLERIRTLKKLKDSC
ncbi:hypothetical protein GGR57DRAFT_507838 [Xylariaceae sp. FL1272]|nr:hypothetical protein GGR57DRAFT_507838 [Xylariaceae sp. FL1272]